MALQIKKIYIDSRHATTDSVDSSNFNIELQNTYYMPYDTVFFITDVCIPHSWYTLEFDINNRLYFQITILSNTSYYIATMNEGVYNGTEFATELPSAIGAVVSGVTVAYNSVNNSLRVTPSTGYIKNFYR